MTVLAHAFTMVPTDTVEASVAAYVAGGLEVLWEPDRDTTLLGVGGRACVMVEDDPAERALGPGPVLLVRDVSMLQLRAGDRWAIAPMRVPIGGYGAIESGGTALRYLDLTSCEGPVRAWFGDQRTDG